jgi:two-component system chemotaxis response regulator CheY
MPTSVLIVDDALFMRSMIRDILTGSGRFEIAGEAETGREAIERYSELRPGIVTMDIVMPQMDGIEATRRILAIDPEANVVMCSALGQEALVIESMSAGARDFIVKPFSPDRVLDVLDSVVPVESIGDDTPSWT